MSLESQLQAIIPMDKYVEVSQLPSLYQKAFNTQLNLQPKGMHTMKMLKQFPTIFRIVNEGVKGETVYVTQHFSHVQTASKVGLISPPAPAPAPAAKQVTKHAAPLALDKAAKKIAKFEAYKAKLAAQTAMSHPSRTNVIGTGPVAPYRAQARTTAPVHLNDRNEVTIPLTEITAYLQVSHRSVPRGQLSSFLFTRNSKKIAERRHSLITETSDNRGTIGSTLLGLSLDVPSSDWRSSGGDHDGDESGDGRSYNDGSEDEEYQESGGSTSNGSSSEQDEHKAVYWNTNEPFCAICIGVQGAGKSHTMNVILENCLLGKVVADDNTSIISTTQPMCGLVLHYDQSQSNVCEAVGLCAHASRLGEFPELKVQRLVVLVSPTYYVQRKAFYGDHCEVVPLLFDWDSLTATQLKKLMRLTDTDAQLYVSVILNKLREYQRKNKIPSFDGFLQEVTELCNVSGQSAPLMQVRLLQHPLSQAASHTNIITVYFLCAALGATEKCCARVRTKQGAKKRWLQPHLPSVCRCVLVCKMVNFVLLTIQYFSLTGTRRRGLD